MILIGATNMPSHLDPALVRPGRFDRKVYLGLPVQGERKEILEYYLSKHALDEDVDALAMARATAGFSGADLENMVNWAVPLPCDLRSLPSLTLTLAPRPSKRLRRTGSGWTQSSWTVRC